MTSSRERVLTSLAHKEPDRLPIDSGAMRSTGIQALAYQRLKQHLGIAGGHVRVFDVIQQLAEPEPWYLERFLIDAINAGREFAPVSWKPWVLPDGSPCEIPDTMDFREEGDQWVAFNDQGMEVARMLPGCSYFTQTRYPMAGDDWQGMLDRTAELMGQVCWAALAEPIYAAGLSDDNLAQMGEHVRKMRETSGKATMIAYGANLFEWACYLRRMDNVLMDLASAPSDVEKLLDQLVEIHLAGLDRLLPVVGDHVDLIQLGDDLGMESGLFFSPEVFRQLFKPRYKLIIDRIKQLSPNLKVFLHSCGSIYPILEDLVEVGIEVINPVQISAKGMDPATLKKEFGQVLSFWGGGCDTQRILPGHSPQEVRDHVRRNIEIFAPGGGFVFNQVHNILSEVPPANVVAMFEAALE